MYIDGIYCTMIFYQSIYIYIYIYIVIRNNVTESYLLFTELLKYSYPLLKEIQKKFTIRDFIILIDKL